ncbi:MAG: cell division protein ZapA [Gammaproteobacteria bacterium]|nr:MAG: cell division protein ZapA [Gammaproteobacteria bacterium]
MRKEPDAIKVRILDKEYLVACPEGEKEALTASAKFLNQKMLDIRESGKVVGIDRIAVMTALNLAHEVIGAIGSDSSEIDSYGQRIGKLNSRIEKALNKYQLEGLH